MSEFIDRLWESMWTGLTPVIMVFLFLMGFKMARKFSELGVGNMTIVLAYIGGCIILPLTLPFFTMMRK